MKALKFYPVLVLSLVSLFFACKKDGLSDSGNTGTKLLGIEQDASNYTTLTYNSKGLMATYKNVDGGFSTFITTNYNDDGKPATASGNGVYYKFVYNNTRLDKVECYKDQSFTNLSFSTQFTYSNNKVIQADFYAKDTGVGPTYLTKTTFEYNTAGDVKTEKIYYTDNKGNVELTDTKTYEYDDKINPMAGIFDYKAIVIGTAPSHNIIKLLDYGNGNTVAQTVTFTYTYNAMGYPMQAQRNFSYTGYSNISTANFIYK
jgi:hypothetical protein